MHWNKNLKTENDQIKNNHKEEFNLTKYNHLSTNADDFFEASLRCSFYDSIKSNKYPLLIPAFTNKAFACELYIKATLYLIKNVSVKEHKLDQLFLKLDEKDQEQIYHIWRTFAGENIPDCDYIKNTFSDNLKANNDVYRRFRYGHEWAGTTISLPSSFVKTQMDLHPLSSTKPIGSPPIYDGFLEQFAKAIKKYNNKLIKLKLKNN